MGLVSLWSKRQLTSYRRLRVDEDQYREMEDSAVNHSEVSNEPTKTLLRFLDLPPEIRNHVYILVLPQRRNIRFYPQMFENNAPEDLFLLIYEWPYYSGRPGDIRICRKLFQLNQQIRAEVASIFYGRKGSNGTHHFQFTGSHCHWPKFEAVTELGTADRHAALLLQEAGIPFATLKTKTWASFIGWYRFELLVPECKGGLVRWMKLKDVEDSSETEDRMIVWIRQEAKRRSCEPLRLEAKHFEDDYWYSNYPA